MKGDGIKKAAGALTSAIDPTSLTAKGDQSPLDRRGSLAAVYLGRLFSGSAKSGSLQVNLAEEIQKAEYPTRNPRETFVLTQALFQIGESAWEDYVRSQDGWIARGKRSKDLLGRLFEGMALETRIRWESARRGSPIKMTLPPRD